MGMKAWVAVNALALALAACGEAEPEEAAAAAMEAPVIAPDAAGAGEDAADAAPEAPPEPAGENVPAFALIYPGGEISPPGEGEAPELDPVAYLTAASPDEVLDFYQEQAEKAGLSPVMALRQGERGGFGALSATTGESLDVWAEQVEGRTRVTLSWATGREA